MSVEQAFHKNTLSISQRPTVIRFTEKKVEINGTWKTGELFLLLTSAEKYYQNPFLKK